MVSKYLKKIGRVSPPPKPTPKPRGELRKKDKPLRKSTTSDAFLARRGVLGGVKGVTLKKAKVPGYMEGAITGAGAATASALYLKNKSARKEAKASQDKKLKKSIEEHKKKTEAKRKKYGKHHG